MEYRLTEEQLNILKDLSDGPIKFESTTEETRNICRYLIDLGMAKFLSVNMMRVGAEITEAGRAHLEFRLDSDKKWHKANRQSIIAIIISIVALVISAFALLK